MGKFEENVTDTLEYISKTIDGSSNKYFTGIFHDIKTNVSYIPQNNTLVREIKTKVEQIYTLEDMNNRFNDISGKIGGVNEQISRLSESIDKIMADNSHILHALETDKAAMESSLKYANDLNAANEGRINSLIADLNRSEMENQINITSIAALKERITKNESDMVKVIAEKDQEIENEKTMIGQKEIELSEKESTIKSLEARISALEDKVSGLNCQLDSEKKGREDEKLRFDAERDSLLREINKIHEENNQKLSNLTSKLNEANAIKEQLSSRVSSIDSSFDGYKPLLLAMENCPTFKSILSSNGIIGNDDVEDLSKLSRLVGNTINFADLIYTTALENKKASMEYMSGEEANVYAAINKCYRDVCHIDYDLFVNPGDQSVTAPYEKVKFNKMEVDNMLDPRKNVLKFSKKIFVPMMKSLTGVLRAKGQVEASNI